MGRLGINILEGELFIPCLVVVECGCILYNVNGYTTVMDYTIVVSILHIVLYLTNYIIVRPFFHPSVLSFVRLSVRPSFRLSVRPSFRPFARSSVPSSGKPK